MSATHEELYVVLVALPGEDWLLLPNIAVADVIAGDALRSAGPVALADGCAGFIDVAGQRVPVASLTPTDNFDVLRRRRILLLQATTPGFPHSRYGVLAEGYPQLLMLGRQALQSLPLRLSDAPERVGARVRIASREAQIPDLERVELLMRQAMMNYGGG